MGDTLTHGALEVGGEDEDVEARGAGHFVVEIARGACGEADGGVWSPFAVGDGDGSVIDRHRRTECRNGVWQVEAEHEMCVLCEEGAIPLQNTFARAIERREMILVGFELVTSAAQLGEGEVRGAADKSEVGTRGAEDTISVETAFEVVGREEGGERSEVACAHS